MTEQKLIRQTQEYAMNKTIITVAVYNSNHLILESRTCWSLAEFNSFLKGVWIKYRPIDSEINYGYRGIEVILK